MFWERYKLLKKELASLGYANPVMVCVPCESKVYIADEVLRDLESRGITLQTKIRKDHTDMFFQNGRLSRLGKTMTAFWL